MHWARTSRDLGSRTLLAHSDPAMYSLFAPDIENPTREDVTPGFSALNALPIPWVESQDISAGMLYLAAESGRYITGETLTIAAGWNANNAA